MLYVAEIIWRRSRINEWMNGAPWNDSDWVKRKYLTKTLTHWRISHHKSHEDEENVISNVCTGYLLFEGKYLPVRPSRLRTITKNQSQ